MLLTDTHVLALGGDYMLKRILGVVCLVMSGAAWGSASFKSLRINEGADPAFGLLLFPGAYVEPARYDALAEAIVEQTAGQAIVMIPKFLGGVANPLEAKRKMAEALEYLESKGISSPKDALFMGGHSEGGIMAHGVVAKENLAGLVLLGSYINRTAVVGSHIKTYPRPVLTLAAELDGLTGINYIAREAFDGLLAVEMGGTKLQELKVERPVVFVPGANHMQFADGGALKGDLPAEITVEDAHAKMAQVISAFLLAQTSKDFTGKEAMYLVAETDRTLKALAPLTRYFNREGDVCAHLQRLKAPLAHQGWSQGVVVTRSYLSQREIFSFIRDKARVNSKESGFTVEVPVYAEYVPNLADVSSNAYVSPEVVACKLRSIEALARETGFAQGENPLSCAELNLVVIQDVLSTFVGTSHESRLEARFGHVKSWMPSLVASNAKEDRWQYGPISLVSAKKGTGQTWVSGGFHWHKGQAGTWLLETSELETSADFPIKAFAGASYCKVISPLRVAEWVALFSMK